MLVLGRSRCDNSMPTFVWRPVTNFVTKPPKCGSRLCHWPFFLYRSFVTNYIQIAVAIMMRSHAVAVFFPSFWDDINQPPTSHLVDPEVCAAWCCREFFHDRVDDGEWPELSRPRGAAKKCPRRRREAGGGGRSSGWSRLDHLGGEESYPTQWEWVHIPTGREVRKIIDSSVSNRRGICDPSKEGT